MIRKLGVCVNGASPMGGGGGVDGWDSESSVLVEVVRGVGTGRSRARFTGGITCDSAPILFWLWCVILCLLM